MPLELPRLLGRISGSKYSAETTLYASKKNWARGPAHNFVLYLRQKSNWICYEGTKLILKAGDDGWTSTITWGVAHIVKTLGPVEKSHNAPQYCGVLDSIQWLLYIGEEPLNNSRLQVHARRFRDILAGDVLRGVRVGLGSEDDTLARVGALQTVVWRIFKAESDWTVEDTTGEAPDESVSESIHNRGLLVEVTYEKAKYSAILLRATSEDDMDDSVMSSSRDEAGFLRLPLILTRMPLSLRETFIQYVCRIFDTRVSALKLEGKHLTESFEQYTSDSINTDATNEERQVSLQKIIKEVQISIGFDIPGGSAALKTIDIHIAREDLPRMLARGNKITKDKSPFMAALKSYVKAHLALDLGHERVKIVKIACGSFVLGEGRLKLTRPLSGEHEDDGQHRATRQLLDSLVVIASGRGILGEK